ncbi:MAG: M3 family metallopeptidase, partial [Kiritimatiellia bacterium]|nr:M3 family metallopeptidase [Kiritimatiellia bacterium]
LKPFDSIDRLVEGCRRVFRRMDPALAAHFDRMADSGLLDLDSRVGKAPGGYQSSLDEVRMPFIFMNAVGLNRDVTTLLHESGHAFHSVLARQEPLFAYRHAPMEFCEVASMSMELLSGPFLDEFYGPGDLARANRERLDEVLSILPWVATIDAFQHWIYTHPGHSAQERGDQWLSLTDRFGAGPILDESDFEEARRFGWHRQLHLFQVPFYYMEYGIAQLGALQVWMRARKDREAALADYRKALSLGGSRPLPELFQEAGIRFDFGPDILRPLIDEVLSERKRLTRAEVGMRG